MGALSRYVFYVPAFPAGRHSPYTAPPMISAAPAIRRGVVGLVQQQPLRSHGRAGVALTSDGARLLPLAKGLCDQYRRLQTEVDDLHGIQSGLIRIGVFSSVATHWRRWKGSPCPTCVRSRSPCWKRVPARRYRTSSSAADASPAVRRFLSYLPCRDRP